MLHHYIYKLNAFQRISLYEIKKEKQAANLVEARNAFNLPHIVKNNVERQETFTSEQGSWLLFINLE